MGVDVVVIVENSKNISLGKFKEELLQDTLVGELAWNANGNDDFLPWEEFVWKGKKYFTWIFSPRYTYVDLYPVEEYGPDQYQITFCKIMLLVERVAGGPVYIGNDVVNFYSPQDTPADGKFWLPELLDSFCSSWRKIAKLNLEKPAIIF